MAKLPKKLVQAPAFDSPLRRTLVPALTVLEETKATIDDASGMEPPIERHQTRPSEQDSGQTDELLHRVTVRLSKNQWEAVQTECYRLRMRGQKTNASALIRDIVENWMTRDDNHEPV